MNNLYQRHFEIQYAVKEIVYGFMQNNGVSSLEMEDALSSVLSEIKNENYRNFFIELQSQSMTSEKVEQKEENEING